MVNILGIKCVYARLVRKNPTFLQKSRPVEVTKEKLGNVGTLHPSKTLLLVTKGGFMNRARAEKFQSRSDCI